MRIRAAILMTLGLSIIMISMPVQSQTLEHKCHFGGWPTAAVTMGDYAFLGAGSSIIVLDMALETPRQVASVLLPEEPVRFIRSGNYIYVPDQESGLRIIDISDPLNPSIIGALPIENGNAEDVAVSGNYAYVADQRNGLVVVDVTDPASPDDVGFLAMNASAVFVQNDYAYVLEYIQGGGGQPATKTFYVVDVSDPANPNSVGSCPTRGAERVFVLNNHAYIATFFEGGIQIVDISSPDNPHVVGNYGAGAYVTQDVVAFEGSTYACFTAQNNGLIIVDVSDPSNPVEVKILPEVHSVRLHLNYPMLYVVGEEDTPLKAVDLTDPNDPIVTMEYSMPTIFACQFIYGDYLYVGTGSGVGMGNSLFVYSMQNPSYPAVLMHYPNIPAEEIYASDNKLYSVTDEEMTIFDASDPTNLIELKKYDIGYRNGKLFILGDYAYYLCWDRLIIIDISDSQNPQQTGELPNGGNDIFVKEGSVTVYAASNQGLHVIDATDPQSPSLIKTVGTYGSATCVWIDGSTAYVGSNTKSGPDDMFTVESFDVSDRNNPSMIAQTISETGYINDLAVRSDYVYTATSRASGLYIYKSAQLIPDLRWEGSASLVSLYTHKTVGKSMDNDNTNTAVSSDDSDGGNTNDHDTNGTMVQRDTDGIQPDVFQLYQNHPNPFNPETSVRFSVKEPCHVHLRVYDILGREVITLVDKQYRPGTYQVTFDAKDLPSGLYFYRIRMKDFHDVKKMLLLE